MKNKFFLLMVCLGLCTAIGFSSSALAAIKDSDYDGLSDEGEVTMYKTDPMMSDTDGDGVGDGDEIVLGTNPLDAKDFPGSSEGKTRANASVFSSGSPFSWYFARVTGIVSFFLLTLVVVHGLVMSSRAFVRAYPAAVALEVHQFLSWAAIATVVLHFGSFLFDRYLPMTITETLIPFLFQSAVLSRLGFDLGVTVALGIIAFYLMLVLTLTSTYRSKMPLKLWRAIHYTSFAAYPLFLAHGILSGSDSREWWAIALYGISGSVVLILIITRLVFRNRAVRLERSVAKEKQEIQQGI